MAHRTICSGCLKRCTCLRAGNRSPQWEKQDEPFGEPCWVPSRDRVGSKLPTGKNGQLPASHDECSTNCDGGLCCATDSPRSPCSVTNQRTSRRVDCTD